MILGLNFFKILLKDIFRAPSQCVSTWLKMQRENACCYPIFSCSNTLYFFFFFFAKLFLAISCKTFPKGVTVIEILTLPGDSQRTKCSLGEVHNSIHLLPPQNTWRCHMQPTLVSLHPEFHVIGLDCSVLMKSAQQSGENSAVGITFHGFKTTTS